MRFSELLKHIPHLCAPLFCLLIIILIEILQYQLQLHLRIYVLVSYLHSPLGSPPSLPSRQVVPLSFGTWDMHLSYFTIAFNAQHIFYDAFGQMECNGMPRRFLSQLVSVQGRGGGERGPKGGAESQIVYICE